MSCFFCGYDLILYPAKLMIPFSPDHVLTLLNFLKKKGFGAPMGVAYSIEVNIDRRKLRNDASYSIQVIEGSLLKVYQHGTSVRV
jgi:hypothetical protein